MIMKVEEFGEYIIFGIGEFYMDCVLYDLCCFYVDMEVRVLDFVV